MPEGSIENPILNGPYEAPTRHFEIANEGGITGEILMGRRPSESFIPIAPTKKGKKNKAVQAALDFDVTDERRDLNSLINDIRAEVELWRARQYPGVTPYTRKLLQHCCDVDDRRTGLGCPLLERRIGILRRELRGFGEIEHLDGLRFETGPLQQAQEFQVLVSFDSTLELLASTNSEWALPTLAVDSEPRRKRGLVDASSVQCSTGRAVRIGDELSGGACVQPNARNCASQSAKPSCNLLVRHFSCLQLAGEDVSPTVGPPPTKQTVASLRRRCDRLPSR